MADKTKIEWAANADGTPGATWNPLRARDIITGKVGTFCVHASEGCRNCYAETFQGRSLPNNGIGLPYTAPNLKRVEHYLDEKMLTLPLRKTKPTTFFLSSMTDVFGEWVDYAIIDQLFAVMAASPKHTFIVLTKRAKRMRDYMRDVRPGYLFGLAEKIAGRRIWHDAQAAGDARVDWPAPNIVLVVSTEDQDTANERIPYLLATPAAMRGVSIEPQIGPIDLRRIELPKEYNITVSTPGLIDAINPTSDARFYEAPAKLDWVIVGGESGRNARPLHPDWATSLRDQCAEADVPFFFKQWGEWTPDPVDEVPGNTPTIMLESPRFDDKGISWDGCVWRVGKSKAGHLLAGVEYHERPELLQPKAIAA